MATLVGSLAAVLTAVMALPSSATAWNSRGRMLSGAISFQILRRESAITIEATNTILEKHP